MTKNVGKVDKIVRYIISIVFLALVFTRTVEGSLAVILGIAAMVLLATGAMSFCGLYKFIGLNTKSDSTQK
ncbi:MAG: DUF2892 domain-containing protein [Spirochaetia bacterium]